MLSKSSEFAERVKSLRSTLGLSQEELAKELGVSFATVNRWENGKTQASRLAVKQFEQFCQQQQQLGKL